MKRFFFSLIALSAVAVGCTQSAMLETPDLGGTAISFSPYTGRTPVTKAQEIVGPGGVQGVYGLAEADGFHILSFLNGTDVYMNGQVKSIGGVWTYGEGAGEDWKKTIMYWPDASSSSTLSFVAYSENATNHIKWSTKQDEINNVFTFTVDDIVRDQVDFLATAYQPDLSLKKDPSGLVSLTFNHLLSRIGFKVQTSTDKKVTITALSLSGKIPTTGTLTLNEAKNNEVPALDPVTSDNTTTYALDLGSGVDIVDANNEAKPISAEYMMLVPHGVNNHLINVTYKIDGSINSKTISIPLEDGFEFKAGRAYDFILKISTSRITFDVDESDWNTDHDKAESDNTLIPEEQNSVSAVVKVNPTILDLENSKYVASADITLIANKANLGTLGVEYKLATAASWTPAGTISTYTENKPTSPIVLSPLDPNSEYVYRAYSQKTNEDKVYYSEGSFVTKAAISVTVNITNNGVEIFPDKATVSATYDDNLTVTEKGFCFVAGESTPTIENKTKVETEGNTFSHTYLNLQPLTQYTCCAYIIIDGIISYSSPETFWTAPNVTVEEDKENNTDGGGDTPPDGPPVDSWEGEDDPEIEF